MQTLLMERAENAVFSLARLLRHFRVANGGIRKNFLRETQPGNAGGGCVFSEAAASRGARPGAVQVSRENCFSSGSMHERRLGTGMRENRHFSQLNFNVCFRQYRSGLARDCETTFPIQGN
jgi:hypothetical protein